jgi:hypothetical protein
VVNLTDLGDKNMLNDLITKIQNIADSINYDVVNITNDSDIKWDTLDLSVLPPVPNWSSMDNLIERVTNLVSDVETSLQSSRLSSEKKEACKTLLASINNNISVYVNADASLYDMQYKKYESADRVRSILNSLDKYVPTSQKSEVSKLARLMCSACTNIYSAVLDIRYILRGIEEAILDKAEANRCNKYVKEIEESGLSLDVLSRHDDSAFMSALGKVAYNKYGNGGALLVTRLLYCLHTREDKKLVVSWGFPNEMKDFITAARELGVKDFYFYGDSSSALESLYIFSKEGVTISFEKLKVGSLSDIRTVAHITF